MGQCLLSGVAGGNDDSAGEKDGEKRVVICSGPTGGLQQQVIRSALFSVCKYDSRWDC